ncbi:MAG: PKD domain-containing protein, partial [Halobacteriales archaeon]|nr:PKD domain-containing protein [Halobacteriales archaeon]
MRQHGQVQRNAWRALALACVASLMVAVAPPVHAAALCGLAYSATPAQQGSTIPGATPIVVFAVTTPLLGNDVVRISFPAGTTFASPLAASDFVARQVIIGSGACGAGSSNGTNTAASAVAVAATPATGVTCNVPVRSGSGCPTLDITLSATTTWRSGNGLGLTYIGTSPTGGGKIRHPPLPGASGAYTLTVETRRAGLLLDGPIATSNFAILQASEWRQFHSDAARSAATIGADVDTVTPAMLQSLAMGGKLAGSPLVLDLGAPGAVTAPDGKMEVVAANDVANAGDPWIVRAYERTGGAGTALSTKWSFQPAQPTCNSAPPTLSTTTIAAGDLNGDGTPEIVVNVNFLVQADGVLVTVSCNIGRVYILNGATGGTLYGPLATGVGQRIAPLVADVDGDGLAEVLVQGSPGSATCGAGNAGTYQTLYSIRWNGAAYVNAYANNYFCGPATEQTSSMAVGEWRSGHAGLELVLGMAGNTATGSGDTLGTLFLCLPTSGAPNCSETRVLSSGVRGVAVADLDGDQWPELVVNKNGANAGLGLSVFQGSGLAASLAGAAELQYGEGKQWDTPTLGDVSGEGLPDIVNVNYSEYIETGTPTYIGSVHSHLYAAGSFTTSQVWTRAATNSQSDGGGALFNAGGPDRRAEFVFGSEDNNLYYTQFSATSVPSALWTLPFNPATDGTPNGVPAVGDVNGDCRSDVLIGTSIGNLKVVGDTASGIPTAPAAIANLQAIPTGDPAYPSYLRVDRAPLGVVDTGDAIYAAGSTGVRAGAFRFNDPDGAGPLAAGTTVTSLDSDLAAAWSPAFRVLRVDNAPAGLGTEDTLYSDNDASNTVSAGDFRFTAYPGFAAGTTVAAGNADLGAALATAARVDLSWTAPAANGAPLAAYKIYRSQSPGVPTVPANLLATVVASVPMPSSPSSTPYAAPPTAYTDLEVAKAPAPGQYYYYKVQATNCMGEAPTSNEAKADLIVPGPVTAFKALPDGNPAYRAYLRVDRAPLGVVDASDAIYAGGGSTVMPGGFRFNDPDGAGPMLAGSTVLTPDADVGAAVSWAVPILRVDNAPAGLGTEDTVYADNDASGAVSAGDLRFTAYPGFPAGTTVSAGNPDAAAPLAPEVQVALIWTAPTSPTTPASPNYNANCQWLEGYDIYRSVDGGAYSRLAVVGPMPWPRTMPAPLASLVAPGAAALGFVDPTVSRAPYPGHQYSYRVVATNCVGEAAPATSDTAVADVELPNAPTMGTLQPSGPPAYSGVLQVRVPWTAPATLRGCGPLDGPTGAPFYPLPWAEGYRVYRSGATMGGVANPANLLATVRPVPAWPRPLLPPASVAPSLAFVDDGSAPGFPLTSGGTYYYAVSAVNCVGEGPLAETSVTLNPPSAPTGLQLRAAGAPAWPLTAPNLRIDASWGGPTSTGACSFVEGYRVFRSTTGVPTQADYVGMVPNPSGWPRTPPASAPAAFLNTFASLPLSIGVTYHLAVSAVNCVGEGPMGAEVVMTPQLPAAVTTLTGQGGTMQATLSWSAAAVNTCWFEGYRVYRAPATGGPFLLVGTVFPPAGAGITSWPRAAPFPSAQPSPAVSAAPSFTDLTALDDNEYDYRVTAVNCVGEGSVSNTVRLYIGANDPPTVAAPVSDALRVGSTLTFAPPLNGITVADVDGRPTDFERLTLSVSTGRLSLSGVTGLSFACAAITGPPSTPAPVCSGTGTSDASMTLRGTLANLNAALNGLLYDPMGAPCTPPAPLGTLTATLNDEGHNGFESPPVARAGTAQFPIYCGIPPAWTPGAPPTVLEDAGAVSLANRATALQVGSGGSPTALRFILSNDNPGLFAVQPALSPSVFTAGPWLGGTLSFTPALDRCGTATVTYQLQDNGGTTSRVDVSQVQAFSIGVTCVNDAPVFVPGSLVLDVGHDQGALTFAGWASAIAPARATATDETGGATVQQLRFDVTNSDSSLFAVQPRVSPATFAPGPWSGTLTFTPALNHFGSSDLSVCLRDDGGVANLGQDVACVAVTIRLHGPPHATPDCFAASGNLDVSAPGVAANDLTSSGVPPAVQLVAGPAHADRFLLRQDGSFAYTAHPGYTGSDSFTYVAVDGPYRSVPATVCLEVGEANGLLGPAAAFGHADPLYAGTPVTFWDQSSDGAGVVSVWRWDFGDGTDATGRSATHTYATDGIYTVTLTVWDDHGLTSRFTQAVTVLPLPLATLNGGTGGNGTGSGGTGGTGSGGTGGS